MASGDTFVECNFTKLFTVEIPSRDKWTDNQMNFKDGSHLNLDRSLGLVPTHPHQLGQPSCSAGTRVPRLKL
jgi:hypothetical protein